MLEALTQAVATKKQPKTMLKMEDKDIKVTSVNDSELQLTIASDALNAGDFESAQLLARSVLAQAEERDDVLMQAKALSLLADRDRLLSKCRRAHDSSQRAAYLFRVVGDIRGEVAALTTLSHTASNLGRNEDAVEAALLGVRLAEKLPPGLHSATTQNYLGVAYLWSRNWERARMAFDAAIQATKACVPMASPAQPLLNQCMADLFRYSGERAQSGSPMPVGVLEVLAGRFEQIAADESVQALSLSGQATFDCLLRCGLAIVYAWLGKLEKAARLLDVAREIMKRTHTKTWLKVFHAWAQAELAWKSGDFATAERAAAQMVQAATDAEHEQLACVGQLLWIRIAEAQGRYAQSLEELHRLRSREQQIRAEAIQSRERAVQWQLDARGSEASLLSLEVNTRQLEKLSQEDPLTGLQNRRSFESRLGCMLATQGNASAPLCVALIDVDQFKAVNDSFSHQVGDKVLRVIAEILSVNMREHDVAARWGGDEFVVALAHPAAVAGHVCERICASIREFDWSSVVPGLSASVSVGVAQAERGDTVEMLLHRSDLAMYADKKVDAGGCPAPAVPIEIPGWL